MNSVTARQGDFIRRERASVPSGTEAEANFSLVPAAGLAASLLVSLGLWWGVWAAASSLVSTLW